MGKRIARAWVKAIRDFFDLRILFLSFIAFNIGFIFWGTILYMLGDPFTAWLSRITHFEFSGFWGFVLFGFLTFPLFLIVGFILISVLAFPWVKRVAQKRGHKFRPSKGGLSLFYQIRKAVLFSVAGLFFWFLSLLLFWIPLLPAVGSFLVLTWVQWKLLTLDFWGETENVQSFEELTEKHQKEGLMLSASLTWLAGVPLVNLWFPIFSALVFLRWDEELRNEMD